MDGARIFETVEKNYLDRLLKSLQIEMISIQGGNFKYGTTYYALSSGIIFNIIKEFKIEDNLEDIYRYSRQLQDESLGFYDHSGQWKIFGNRESAQKVIDYIDSIIMLNKF